MDRSPRTSTDRRASTRRDVLRAAGAATALGATARVAGAAQDDATKVLKVGLVGCGGRGGGAV
ncbi:MAG: gfo/Idh/MocA family oxidoreductase, partial [Planctomycetota bacterium]|nr:gfo/Idh/MocA family oxidoreductase [Planctomycetota bacterium]